MQNVEQLVTRLQRAFDDRLVSVILYGSAAPGGSDDRFSDVNILCVLKQVTPRELADGEPVMRWWRGLKYISPLLMSEDEVYHSSDSFPIEFRDMKDMRKVLYGVDVIADINVDMRHHRTQLEHELRAKLIRLRQTGAGVLSEPEKLLALSMDSVSTFCVLGRHALLVSGAPASTHRRAIVDGLAKRLGISFAPFQTLLDLREESDAREALPKTDPGDVMELFAEYLECIEAIIGFVDSLPENVV
jgi:predicted nucleotidyltransferase